MPKTVDEYCLENGSSPFGEWFGSLDVQAAAKITVARARLESGNTSNVKWFRGIGEYVIDWGPGYRIYLAEDGGDLILLFGGGTKKTQQSDIDEAVQLHQEYKARKKAEIEKQQEKKAKKSSPQKKLGKVKR
jgi:putative addiction module killer protein